MSITRMGKICNNWWRRDLKIKIFFKWNQFLQLPLAVVRNFVENEIEFCVCSLLSWKMLHQRTFQIYLLATFQLKMGSQKLK